MIQKGKIRYNILKGHYRGFDICIGIPMQIIEINYPSSIAEAKGVAREIGLQLLPENEIKIGDFVIVHVGFAIKKLDKKQADEI